MGHRTASEAENLRYGASLSVLLSVVKIGRVAVSLVRIAHTLPTASPVSSVLIAE